MLVEKGWSGAFGWDKLLESQRVLIVSEAGAGKTYECAAQKQVLWDRGEPAFHLELAQLATTSLCDLLSPVEEARFEEWRAAQSAVATFFLDSIDELKLTLGSFDLALKRLSKAVAGQFGRVRIVSTTRPIAVDKQLIQKHFPVPEPVALIPSGDAFADIAMGRQRQNSSKKEKGTVPVWRSVALMPLSNEQILEMAAIEGVDDAEALLADIRARNAEEFSRRPQDLIELCADWREHRRIRTHREQVAQNVRVKLKPRTDRREPAQLSPDKSFEGASRIALAALLTRRLTIRLSVEADRSGDPGTALDPSVVLHDWTPEERDTLLERALFGFASYGRVRFHHRSVVEFLAARRLEDRLGQGMPIKEVKRLLFAETHQGIRVVRPIMRPVAAWLAAEQSSIFSEVRDREPEVLLEHADPGSLPLPQRIDALKSYVRHYGQGGWRGLHVPRVQVHRFASPDLAIHVLGLWQGPIENPEVRGLLLELIGAGPIPACADVAHDIANDVSATHRERLDAIDALVRLEDPRLEALTQSIVNAPGNWPEKVVRAAVVRLFPQKIAPDRLYEILKGLRETGNSVDELGWMLSSEIARVEFKPGYLAELRVGFTALVAENLVWVNQWPHLVSRRPYLLSALAAVCLRLIRAGDTDAAVLRSSMIALRLHRDGRANEKHVKDLRNALAELAPPLRAAVYWADDAFNEAMHPQADPWKRVCNVSNDGPLKLNDAQDGVWVRRILADRSQSLPERAMMLYVSMYDVRDDAGDLREYIESLRRYVADEPSLMSLFEQCLAPRKIDPEEIALNARVEEQRQAAERRKAKDREDWVAFWREVAEHPRTAFSPDRKGNTAWNLWQAMQRSGDESRASGWNRRFIEQHFGKDVADQLRTSMHSIWREDRPTLRYERPDDERGTFLIRWQLGLAAIAAEAEDPDWARKLSIEEAELATRYAPIEPSDFPAWLESLARAHPAEVERTLGPDLTAELDEVAAKSSVGILLQNVSHAPATVLHLFLPRLRAWLDTHSGNLRDGEDNTILLERLVRVLEILLEHGDGAIQDRIRAMAEDYLKGSADGVFTPVWLTTLMRLDPASGTNAIETLLGPLTPGATGFAINVFGTMFGEREGQLLVDLRKSGFTPTLLLRLARLSYKHVRIQDDITHEGAYSPGPRDWAQDGRNVLLSAILDARGTDAWAVKLEMVKEPLFADFRDRLALLAREKAAEEVSGGVLTESGVSILDRYGSAPPMTRDDMFAMLVDRLDDLDDLLLQDVSPRGAWGNIKDEKTMRQVIALQLRNAANRIYTVDQEAVTADEKETDIRLRVASSGQQGTIELKIGEHWSGRDLRDTVNNQLVTKYMAAETCRSGCLLVTVASNQNWKNPDTGETLDINGLRKMLDAEAARIVDKWGGSVRVAAKVLDLRPRLTAEAKIGGGKKE
ncbi:ATP-binding protein [Myxococcus llanfairpwllgwyngyllgogerychwyrndrobwllllantysiliogogogochensis]|uniref:ATP-binding protein n=1 Tax=Myxococcus llanfairpwllgwyngyllgogerychwyrndrobwllllantysiliogogogochensis TaxID=2590453 RepID=A0A540WYX4_9BACT|nr:ATP-binding protein [Myxococcus llanfairpwllgwyngyllgogerychwyrndrobwllllantysiliogogogochensis]TQF14188.1 ATP-binding protein [Myxococcus llanfairpwllgwyngyllgogerychwyrndrobwllllantysiliogogogochensis]